MKKIEISRFIYRIISVFLVIAVFLGTGIVAMAEPSSDREELEEEIDETQEKLDEANTTIEELLELSRETEDELDEADCALVQILAEIEVIEEQISDKEEEIILATDEYNAAVQKETEQYESMKVRIRYLYEMGDVNLISIYMETGSITETLTKADYVEDLYEYDRMMLNDYQDTVAEVALLKHNLEIEKDELVTIQSEYEAEQLYLEEVVDELKAISDSYAVEISAAKNKASEYAKLLKQQNKELKRLQEEEARKAREEAERKAAEEAAKKAKEEAAKKAAEEEKKKGSSSDNEADDADDAEESQGEDNPQEETPTPEPPPQGDSKYDVSSIYNAKGSDLGKSIAVYGCQFIGNPYVPGGTSLTNGADCSGFVFSVYKDFGYTVPRTSYSLRSAGTEVAYSDAEPGDVVCYPGHVAIYIGNGMIVHASTQKTGIKVSNANYRGILCVRRLI